MAFPLVETVATGVVTANATTWTLTYPTGIAADELLIAFLGTDGNPTLSGWPAGWTALRSLDADASAAKLHVWHKKADGTETGTFNVTLSAAEQGAWRISRISGWFGTLATGLEAGGDATGTSTAPDPLSFNPANWDSEDTLWFAVEAADHGNTDATAWPYADGQFSDSSGGANGAHLGTCRTNAATASQDPGAFTIDLSEQWASFVVAVRPASGTTLTPAAETDTAVALDTDKTLGLVTASETDTAPAADVDKQLSVTPAAEVDTAQVLTIGGGTTETGVARISLAGMTEPETRTNHSLTVRARVTNGAHTGTIRMALYEGATNRSGDLESAVLTATLADYTLPISDANAATITSYADLEIRLWGFSSAGSPAVFEVDQVCLETPVSVGATFSITPATETDTAVALDTDKQVTLGVAVETDSGQALKVPKLAPALETDAAQALSISGGPISITPASETDTAQALDTDKSATLGIAAETDAAQALDTDKQKVLAAATETDTAVALNVDKQLAVTAATETDTAQGLRAPKLGVASETDTALELTLVGGVNISPALETDAAVALTVHKLATLTAAPETDTAQVLAVAKALSLTLAGETDEARPILGSAPPVTIRTVVATSKGLTKIDTASGLTLIGVASGRTNTELED